MDFANAKQIFINNKEVNILSLNNEVIWQKTNLVLTSNKSTIQTGDTVTLSATLTKGVTPVSGEEIYFYPLITDPPTSKTLITGVANSVSFKYSFASMPVFNDSSERVYLDADKTIYLSKFLTGVQLCGATGTSCQGGITSVSLENNVLTFVGNGGTYTADVSNKNMSVITPDVPVSINDYGISATTDSNGVATVSYVGKGTGVLNIQAVYNSLTSETYSLFDCVMYDPATGTTPCNKWYNRSNNITVTNENTGTTLTSSGNNGYYIVAPLQNTSTNLADYRLFDYWCAEFDLVDFNRNGGNIALYVNDGNGTNVRFVGNGVDHMDMTDDFRGHVKIYYDSNGFHYQFGDNEVKTLSKTFGTSLIAFVIPATTGAYLKFKDFKIYPI